MPPRNHGSRPSPSPYTAQFDATYNPLGLQTSTIWGGGGGFGRGGHGGGYGYDSESNFDLGGLMDTVYSYKQRAAEAALAREQRAAETALARQQRVAREDRRRSSWQAGALNRNAYSQVDPALQANVARAAAQQSGGIPFNPAASVADYYQYGRGGR